jgi:hypothetical protein
LSDLDELTAEKYSEAHAELSSFVGKAMKRGVDPFGDRYFAAMKRIQKELGVSEECWEYLDLDSLLLSNWQ